MLGLNPVKRAALWAMIAFFVSGGVLSALFFLFGTFGTLEGRVLGTVFSLGFFSLLVLLSSAKLEQPDVVLIAKAGVVTTVLAAVMVQLLIWGAWGPGMTGFKAIAISTIAAFAVAHALALWRPATSGIVGVSMRLTFFFIAMVSLMLIIAALGIFALDELFYRGLGFFAVLDVAGTLVTPLLGKLAGPHE